jgi:hypothetical protein
MVMSARGFGPAFHQQVRRYRRKLFIDVSLLLVSRAQCAWPMPISARSDRANEAFAKLQSGRIQDIVDATHLMAELAGADVADIRGACEHYAPDLLEVIDSLLWLGRLEAAEAKSRISTPPAP